MSYDKGSWGTYAWDPSKTREENLLSAERLGAAVTKSKMDNIEDGIADAHTKNQELEQAKADKVELQNLDKKKANNTRVDALEREKADIAFVESMAEGQVNNIDFVNARKEDKTYVDNEIGKLDAKKADKITQIASGSIAVRKWQNKDLIMLGDSIVWYDGHNYPNGTESIGYPTLLNNAIGFNSILNTGVSGARIAVQSGKSSINLIARGTDFSNCDLVIIAGGTNDWSSIGIIEIGEAGNMSDNSFDTSTFYGAYRDMIEYIYSQNSEINIVLFTPYQRSGHDIPNGAGYKLEDYVNATKEIGKMYAIPVLDLFAKSGINKNTFNTYTIDNLHLNNLGYEKVTNNIIIPFLETV